ncbi:MAG TPA: hypothetical protein VFP84_12925 [Kofleriaceae bacterium]|nr:hypothetical protein [Kofleriaceae bacterium]
MTWLSGYSTLTAASSGGNLFAITRIVGRFGSVRDRVDGRDRRRRLLGRDRGHHVLEFQFIDAIGRAHLADM